MHSGPNVLVVHPSTPFKTFKELVDYVRANPGKLNYGYTHAASGHMAMELLKLEASKCAPGVKDCNGLFMVGIPYRGGGPMMQDLLGGQIPLMFINQDVALPHVKAGKLRALAVTQPAAQPAVPGRADDRRERHSRASRRCRGRACRRSRARRSRSSTSSRPTLRKIMTSPEIKQRLESVGFVVPAPARRSYTQVRAERDRPAGPA